MGHPVGEMMVQLLKKKGERQRSQQKIQKNMILRLVLTESGNIYF